MLVGKVRDLGFLGALRMHGHAKGWLLTSAMLFIFWLFNPLPAWTEDLSFSSVRVNTEHWQPFEAQRFSGSVPSKAWTLRNDLADEILLAILSTEGVRQGLREQSEAELARLYLEALIVGWGAQIEGSGEALTADFCDGSGAYRISAAFGASSFDYFACAKMRSDLGRLVVVVSWQLAGLDSKLAQNRLMTVLQGVDFGQ